jgi:hypothetical protein
MRHIAMSAIAVSAALLSPAVLATEARAADDAPSRATESIVAACNDKRFDAVDERLHSWLRGTWAAMGYTVEDYCALLTRNYTLARIRIDREERSGAYAIVYLTRVYRDGSEDVDRATLLQEKGVWKLSN